MVYDIKSIEDRFHTNGCGKRGVAETSLDTSLKRQKRDIVELVVVVEMLTQINPLNNHLNQQSIDKSANHVKIYENHADTHHHKHNSKV